MTESTHIRRSVRRRLALALTAAVLTAGLGSACSASLEVEEAGGTKVAKTDTSTTATTAAPGRKVKK
jgi:hypothetical protein